MSPNEDKALFSGIRFCDFFEYAPVRLTNILFLKGEYIGNKKLCS